MQLQFDATGVTPQFGGGTPQFPVTTDKKGHLVKIIESGSKETNKQDGHFLELIGQIMEGPHAGETGSIRLNLWNNNAQTVQIAFKQLSAINHVCGVFKMTDTQQLHNIPFRILVRNQRGEDAKEKGYTEVYEVLDANGNVPGKAGPGGQGWPQQGQGGGQPQQQPMQQQPQQQPQQGGQGWPQQQPQPQQQGWPQQGQPQQQPQQQGNVSPPMQQSWPQQQPQPQQQSAPPPPNNGPGNFQPQQQPGGQGGAPWNQNRG